MKKLARPDRTLTAHDLRYLHATIFRELAAGHGFVVLHDGRPLARLLPMIPASDLPPPTEPQVTGPRLERLEALLGQTNLARVLGVTLATFQARRPGLQFSKPVLERLEAIVGVVDDLAVSLPASQIGPWLLRPNKELKGLSTVSILASPWTRGDATIDLVSNLARRERIRHQPSPGSRP